MDRPDPPLQAAADPNGVKTQPDQPTQPHSERSQEPEGAGGAHAHVPAAAGAAGEGKRATLAPPQSVAPGETSAEGHTSQDEQLSQDVAETSQGDARASEVPPPPAEPSASEDTSPEAAAPADQDAWPEDASQVPCVAPPHEEIPEPAPPALSESGAAAAEAPAAPLPAEAAAALTLAELPFRDITASAEERTPALLEPPVRAQAPGEEAISERRPEPSAPVAPSQSDARPEPAAPPATAAPAWEPGAVAPPPDVAPASEDLADAPLAPSLAEQLHAPESVASFGATEGLPAAEPPLSEAAASDVPASKAEPAPEAEPEPEPQPEPEPVPERPSLAAIIARQEAAARAPAAPRPRTVANNGFAAQSAAAVAPAAWMHLEVPRDEPPPEQASPAHEQWTPLAERGSWRTLKPYGIRAAKVAAIVFSGWFTAVICLIVIYRFVNPPFSTLMAMQWMTGTSIRQEWVPIDRISPNLVRAVIASEDGRFCHHWGIDFAEIAAAIRRSSGGVPRGASTITMQVAKNLFLWPSKSYVRKVIEVPLTYALELFWTKRRILEVYLNIAEWGSGIFGAEAAAKAHFGRSSARLSARQGAQLAVALPNPFTRDAGDPGPWASRRASVIQRRAAHSPELASCILGEN